jgi:DNA polymerase-3 subunit delta'
MGFRGVVNQERAKEFLKNCIVSGRIANGYLFHGPRGVGKSTLALAFAQALNCENRDPEGCDVCRSCKRIARFCHPNVTFIFPTASKNEHEEIASTLKCRSENPLFVHTFPEAASIKIKTIQNLRMDLAMGLRESGRRVVILAYAERMTQEASNCLLRILEEPAASVTFVLTVTSHHLLLPTIVSRCQAVKCVPLAAKEIERILVEKNVASTQESAIVARLSGGSLSAAVEFAEQDVVEYRKESLQHLNKIQTGKPAEILKIAEGLAARSDRNQVRIFVHLALLWLRDLLLVKCGAREADIANPDMIEVLGEEASGMEFAELKRKIEILEEIVSSMEQHVELSLLLSSSFLRLAGAVKEPSRPWT